MNAHGAILNEFISLQVTLVEFTFHHSHAMVKRIYVYVCVCVVYTYLSAYAAMYVKMTTY